MEQWQPLVVLSFELLSVWSVLAWGQGGNAGSLLLVVAAGASGGLAAFPQFPQTGLKSLLGWHIPQPCGPNLGICSTGGNWGPSYLKCLPGYLWTLGHSVPGLDFWSMCPDPQICCGQRQPVPGQFGHCDCWGNQECSCQSILSQLPLCLGLFGALAGLLPCPALIREAINLAIWFPNSIVPSTGAMVMGDLALTLSQASSFLLSALQTAIVSWE